MNSEPLLLKHVIPDTGLVIMVGSIVCIQLNQLCNQLCMLCDAKPLIFCLLHSLLAKLAGKHAIF